MNNHVPVLCVQRGGSGDVAIARTLGRLGVPVYLLHREGEATPALESRYWTAKSAWDFSRPEHESLGALLDTGRTIEVRLGHRPVLLTLADWVAIFIERHADALEERFVLPRPAQPIVHRLLDKWEMHVVAQEHGIPTPVTIRPRSRADVEAFLKSAMLPVVVKCADPYVPEKPWTTIAQSRAELLSEIDRQAALGPLNVVVQEYIPGQADSVWMCNGYFGRDPTRAVVFTGKKLRQVSASGIASLAVCLSNATVEAQTRRLMNGVGYRGCVGIGYRLDTRDGLYKLLDVNARVSGVFRLFCGTNEIDVVRSCYLDLTEQSIPATALRSGRKWMLEDDLFVARAAIRDGDLSVPGWIASLRGVRETHWFAQDDLMPFFAWLWNGVRRTVRRHIQRPAGPD